jgi:hypothetical protein
MSDAHMLNPKSQSARPRSGALLIVLIYILLLPALFRPLVYRIDPAGYYSWARSVLIDRDLNVKNEFVHFDLDKDTPTTRTGYKHSQWAAGSGFLWLPAMAVADAAVAVSDSLGAPIVRDGYSWPYVMAAALSSTLAGLCAVLLIYSLGRKLFGNFAALLASIVVWLGTPMVYYQYYEPLFSHANDALLNALFVVLWWHARRRGYRPNWMFALGLVGGAAVWLRTQNVILLAVVVLEAGYDLVLTVWRHTWRSDIRPLCFRVAALLGGFLCLFVPQLLFWRTVYGSWIVNTYQATGGGTFDWRARHVLEVLVSTDRGMFVWAPITVVCLAGVGQLFRADRRLAFLLSTIALFQLYVIGSWSHWEGGAAFGPRFWIAQVPFFTLSLAALVGYVNRRFGRFRSRFVLILVGGLFITWNVLLMLQYVTGMVAATGQVELSKMIVNQFVVASRGMELVAQRLNWFETIVY